MSSTFALENQTHSSSDTEDFLATVTKRLEAGRGHVGLIGGSQVSWFPPISLLRLLQQKLYPQLAPRYGSTSSTLLLRVSPSGWWQSFCPTSKQEPQDAPEQIAMPVARGTDMPMGLRPLRRPLSQPVVGWVVSSLNSHVEGLTSPGWCLGCPTYLRKDLVSCTCTLRLDLGLSFLTQS